MSTEKSSLRARWLAQILGRHRGLATKLGQHLALRADLLTDADRGEFERLLENAPPQPFSAVQKELQRWLGKEEIHFEQISSEALATASVGQVHRAVLRRPRREVVVKVRHPELSRARVANDLRSARRWLRWGLPRSARPALEHLLRGLEPALLREIDFRLEAEHATRIRADLADDPRIVVPRVWPEASAEGVLTLDYVPRLPIDQPAILEARGIEPARVLDIVLQAYSRQVFGDGLFHADPHPGNLYVVDEQDPLAPAGGNEGDPRVLFVDFGLAQELAPELRTELRKGLAALLKRDLPEIVACMARAGAIVPGHEAEAEAALRRALEAGAADALNADSEMIQQLTELGKNLVRNSSAFRIPHELLLWARTLAHLFALARRIAPNQDPLPRLLPGLMRFMSS